MPEGYDEDHGNLSGKISECLFWTSSGLINSGNAPVKVQNVTTITPVYDEWANASLLN